ncbi:CvpA family protein [Neobacillus sp. MM2021_6]|uniref:CvpA family protein n=1 Tax=Bacillaceae TaxID=186817 RepID=UPI00140DB6CA|nr:MULTISPECIES: CvpA family protein [Bacillaceae]MBO0960140.1 CvpA family protein [Neobacillus sp. MM2021_6]NHC17550.1 CvpA family protein [Bacillus sp. MM2020_4]WML40783.1 CvpA family protein [Neobacillus sp. OS1-2]
MLDLAIIIFLIIGFFVGLKRGFILQLVHLLGFIIAYIAAYSYYDELAPKLTLWIPYPNFGEGTTLKLLTDSSDMETAFYRAIAFVIIFFAVKVLFQIVGSMLDFIAHLPVLKQLNIFAGGILGLCEVYLIIFILLYISALIPIELIQNQLDHSILANAIVNHTPILSQQIKSLWIEYTAALTSL